MRRCTGRCLLGAWLSLSGCSQEAAPNSLVGWTEPVTGMEFVLVRAGSFQMGSPLEESQREPQELPHRVTITRDFYLGRYEVTQGEWRRVMIDNPSRFPECGEDCPVETVSRLRVEEFLSRLAAATGERLRLPTEAEWEYSCRAGTDTAFGLGDAISSELANFDGRTPYPGATLGPFAAATTRVGSFPANPWGLHDMNGNVWEWSADQHCPYPEAPVEDPVGACGADLVVIRGGSWYYGPDSARCGLRYTHRPVDDGPSLGFRVVREIPPEGR